MRQLRRALSGVLFLSAFALLVLLLEAPLDWVEIGPSARLTSRAAAATAVAWTLLAAFAAHIERARAAGFVLALLAGSAAALSAVLEVGADARAFKLGIAVFVLVAAFSTVLDVTRRSVASQSAPIALLVAVGLLTAVPLWAAPLAELTAQRQWTVDAIVAVSPLTYVALAADFDYLRTAWFYRASVLGTLRYEYPDFIAATAVYALPAFALALAALRRRRRSRRTAGTFESPPAEAASGATP